MYTSDTSTLPFKDKSLRNQVPTLAFTLPCTYDQSHSSWSPCPNHTPKMRMGPSLQLKGPGRRMPTFQAPNRKPSLLSKLILTPAIYSYLVTAFFTTFMSKRRDTKTVISSAYADTFVERQLARGMPRRAGLAFSSLSLQSRGSKTRT